METVLTFLIIGKLLEKTKHLEEIEHVNLRNSGEISTLKEENLRNNEQITSLKASLELMSSSQANLSQVNHKLILQLNGKP